VFLDVPDADYVYCRDGIALPLASTDFVRYCHATWEVVHTSSTWGQFIDRLTTIDDAMVEAMFPDGVDPYLEDAGLTREDAFAGWGEIEGTWEGSQLPFSGGEDNPYRSWEDGMPDEIIDLADWGTSMASGDFCYLDPEKVPAVLGVIRRRGETAVEDCKLLDELGWLFNGGAPQANLDKAASMQRVSSMSSRPSPGSSTPARTNRIASVSR
jgi:hypothetical protein